MDFVMLAVVLLIMVYPLKLIFSGESETIQPPNERQAKIICPHCQEKGYVTTRLIEVKRGVSGAKATGAVLTGGISLLATGLSRKEWVTQAHCSNCAQSWQY
jgi:hypothetical protein